MSNCNLGLFTVENSKIANLETYFNCIKYLQISGNTFKEVVFSSSQLVLPKLPSFLHDRLKTKIVNDFNFLKFNASLDFDKLSAQSHRVARNETYKFILEHSDVKLDRDTYAHIRYLESISSEQSLLSSFLYRVSGALLKPSRIVLIMAFVISAFTWIYSLPCLQFMAPGVVGSIRRGLTLPESAYYSGVTFTTIGYGDIVPLGLARWLAISEGFFGVLLVSAFLVSLTRKYVE
ncbi:two pore domain potassium channel family protein [Geomonas terrae]|uniref:Two pore domain potassium channel family protein n=2 Tax=Geomonas terrae TaxID=2562681 RepID=A0A4S1CFC5_9BACT|nr:two pore domain potassium channel family protein [Geomonas terrae]